MHTVDELSRLKQPNILDNNGSDIFTVTQQSQKSIEYQHAILKYITDIGASLRLHMDTDTLLMNVSEATCKALGFRHSALYLADGKGYFRVRAVAGGVNAELEEYLRQHPIPEDIVGRMFSQQYRISNSYFIPVEASLWQDEVIASYFVVVDEKGSGSPLLVPPPSLTFPLDQWRSEDLLMVPLLSHDRKLLGFLTPDAPENDLRPTTEMLAFLELFANQAAVVIEGTQLYEEARRSSEERAALIEIGRALSAPEALRDLQTVYQTIYEQVRRVMPADAFFVNRYTREPEGLIMDYFIDEGVMYPPVEYGEFRPRTRHFLYHDTVGLIFSTAGEYAAFAAKEDEVFDDSGVEVFGNGHVSQSLLFVPIRYGEEPIGMLSAQSYQPHAYTQRHLEMLREIGVQAGIAITNARLNAELREALKRAQESERLKNHFLMTASHELRTPLTAIQGYLELLSSFNNVLDTEAKERFVANARRACDELVLLLGNVMDTSRIDQDRVTLSMGEVQVAEAVQVILEIMEPAIARERRSVDVQVDEQLSVWVDDLRLRQILLNVVGNALKYSESSSGLAIRAESVSREALSERLLSAHQIVPSSSANRFVVIATRDWGPGISLEDQKRLFTKFMRLDGAMNSTQRGAGLGLYLCRQLTEAMCGNIWVESTGILGAGSTFFIALPQYDVECLEKRLVNNG